MFKNISYFIILTILGLGLFVNSDFKQVAAGVAIFLFGMRFLQDGFKYFTGGTFEQLLQKSTNKTWKSMIFGFITSSLMQSSSLVGIITISFLSAELITLIQGIGITLGANIGTTTGIWLIAGFGMKINIAALGMPMLVFGIICVFQKNKILKGIGNILAGLGFVFLGIHYMKVGFESFQSTLDLTKFAIDGYIGVLIFTGIGLLATIVMQSSHATILLVIAALATGQVNYENSLALVIGANIGTNVTSFLVALTGNKDSKRLGLNDLILKLIAALIFIVFFYQILPIVNLIGNIIGIGSDPTLKLALYHTLFNLVGVCIMLAFINQFIVVLKKVFPDEKTNVYGNIYLTKEAMNLPDTAIISLIKETRHLYYNTIEVVLEIIGLKQSDIYGEYNFEELKKKIKIKEVEEIDSIYNKKIKPLYGEIIDYSAIAQSENNNTYEEDFNKIKLANRSLAEIVKGMKHMQKNLKRYLRSTNQEIKYQYEKIIYDLLIIIQEISKLQNIKNNDEKLLRFVDIRRKINDNDLINNGTIDRLIREQKISNQMATSLMNDSSYKNDMFKDLLTASKIIFNNDISFNNVTELKDKKGVNWLNDNFGLNKKQIESLVNKYKKQEKVLKDKILEEKDKNKKELLKKELSSIKYFIKEYK